MWHELISVAATVTSSIEASKNLDSVFGPSNWKVTYRFMSPVYCVATIECRVEEGDLYQLTRESCSSDGPERAFLQAYDMLGGKVLFPERLQAKHEDLRAKAGIAPALPSKPQASVPMHQATPNVSYVGPKPWDASKDAYPQVAPLQCPAYPQEPDWFGAEIGGLLKNKHPGVTWKGAIQGALENPGGRDQPFGMVLWALSRPSSNPKFVNNSKAWSAKAKAALIWHMQAQENMPNYDQDRGGYQAPTTAAEEVPW